MSMDFETACLRLGVLIFSDFIPYQEFLKHGYKLQDKDLWRARQRVSIDTVAVLFESSVRIN